jgi:hypothetical protein
VCGNLRSIRPESDTAAGTDCERPSVCSSANNMRYLADTGKRSGMEEQTRAVLGRRGCELQRSAHAVLASSPGGMRPQRIRVTRQTKD